MGAGKASTPAPITGKTGSRLFPRQNLINPCFSLSVSYRSTGSKAQPPSIHWEFLAPAAEPAGDHSSPTPNLRSAITDKPKPPLPARSTSPESHGEAQPPSLPPSPSSKQKPGMRKLCSRTAPTAPKPARKGERCTQTGTRARSLLPVNTRGCFCLSPALPSGRRKAASCASCSRSPLALQSPNRNFSLRGTFPCSTHPQGCGARGYLQPQHPTAIPAPWKGPVPGSQLIPAALPGLAIPTAGCSWGLPAPLLPFPGLPSHCCRELLAPRVLPVGQMAIKGSPGQLAPPCGLPKSQPGWPHPLGHTFISSSALKELHWAKPTCPGPGVNSEKPQG